VKTAPEHYNRLIPPGSLRGLRSESASLEAGRSLGEKLRESVEILRRFEVDYELRTTVAPGIVGPQDMASILPLLPGALRYQLKAFRGGSVLDPSYADTIPPSEAGMEEMRSIAAESGVPCL